VLDAFESNDQVGELLHAASLAVDNQYFEAGIMIQMRVARRDNKVVVFVLRFSQLLGDSKGMMIEDEGNCADDNGIGRSRLLPNQPVANQVAKGFGAIRVSALFNGMVEPLQQRRIEGNPDSA